MDATPNTATTIPFYKIEGAGNDFVVVLSSHLKCGESEKPAFVREIASRNLGVGCDQVLEVTQLAPLAIQIWNADGSKAEMCANGSRAFALLAQTNNWIPKGQTLFPLIVSERTFTMEMCQDPTQGFAINLGKPAYGGREVLPLANGIPFHIVHAPNPHAVIFIGGPDGWIPPEGVEKFDFRVWGPQIERHPRFPDRTNVEFIFSTEGTNQIRAVAKVWERGAGATLSSGSGSVAVATTLWNTRVPQGFPIQVEMNIYKLLVRKNEQGQTLVSGPARIVAKGDFFYDA